MSEEPTKKEVEKTEKQDMISRANEAAARMEAANKVTDELLTRQEKMMVEKTLGGQTDVAPPEKKELTPQEYAAKVMNNDI